MILILISIMVFIVYTYFNWDILVLCFNTSNNIWFCDIDLFNRYLFFCILILSPLIYHYIWDRNIFNKFYK